MPFSSSIEIEDVNTKPSIEKIRMDVTRYVYASSLVASVKDNEVNYYHSDKIHSNRIISDSEGRVISKYKSLPFGQEISNFGVRYSFATGKELDKSGLHYFGARYYDADLGRFTSVDPVKENHAYNYVRNNPLNFVDPTGMDVVYDLWSWTAPIDGSYVEYYAIYLGILDDAGDIEAEVLYGYAPASPNPAEYGQDESYLLGYDDNINYRVRVSGFDIENREGPKSEWSTDRFGEYGGIVGIDDEPGINNEQISENLFPTISKIHPNPAEYTQRILINNGERNGGTFSWRVFDVKGRAVRDFEFDMVVGENEFEVDYSGLSAGTYLGALFWNDEIIDSTKFMVVD